MADLDSSIARYQELHRTEPSGRTVWLLGIQCCLAAKLGQLVSCKPDPTKFGGNWDDPSKFAPPDISPTRY